MAVFIAVGLSEGKLLIFKQDECRIHVIREVTDINFGRDKLHGDIIADFVNGDGGVFPYLTCNTVIKAVIQSLPGCRFTGMAFGS